MSWRQREGEGAKLTAKGGILGMGQPSRQELRRLYTQNLNSNSNRAIQRVSDLFNIVECRDSSDQVGRAPCEA